MIKMRLGIHSSSAIAGIVGYQKYVYDVWGDAVQVANSMESEGEPMKLHVSGATYDLIKDDFSCTERVKTPGSTLCQFSFPTYLVDTENPSAKNKSYVNEQTKTSVKISELQTALEHAIIELPDQHEKKIERHKRLAEINSQIDVFVKLIEAGRGAIGVQSGGARKRIAKGVWDEEEGG